MQTCGPPGIDFETRMSFQNELFVARYVYTYEEFE